MGNITLGQYISSDSLIHKLDPRTKIISVIFMIIAVFLVPSPLNINPIISFVALAAFGLIVLLIVALSKVSVFKFLNSLRHILFLLIFTFIIQAMTTKGDEVTLLDTRLEFSIIKIVILVAALVLFVLLRKYIKSKMIVLLALLVGGIYLLTLDFGSSFGSARFVLYKTGTYNGLFYALRIFLVLLVSTALTLTTKPTDLTTALEWLLHPLTYLKINVAIFAMMISLALRFIPTLFNETQKILKAQASRGVDFKEGNLKSQIGQIVALLIPMFVISYNRASDLADAMEARTYIPGAPRTRINVLKFHIKDFVSFILVMIIFVGSIVLKTVL